jgi:hypothetical protein
VYLTSLRIQLGFETQLAEIHNFTYADGRFKFHVRVIHYKVENGEKDTTCLTEACSSSLVACTQRETFESYSIHCMSVWTQWDATFYGIQKSRIEAAEQGLRPGCSTMVEAFSVVTCEIMTERVQMLKQIKEYHKESLLFTIKDRIGWCTGN